MPNSGTASCSSQLSLPHLQLFQGLENGDYAWSSIKVAAAASLLPNQKKDGHHGDHVCICLALDASFVRAADLPDGQRRMRFFDHNNGRLVPANSKQLPLCFFLLLLPPPPSQWIHGSLLIRIGTCSHGACI